MDHKPYKGTDAVTLECQHDYTTKAGAPEDRVNYKAGKSYVVSPSQAVHFLRKVYAVRKELEDGTMKYIGDRPMFIDPKSEAAQRAAEDAKANKAEAKAEDAKANKAEA